MAEGVAPRPLASLASLLLLVFASPIDAGHSGAFTDPNHFVGSDSFAGMRYISEAPAHQLTVVGTDDGIEWWTLSGTCGGKGMRTITLDFSTKHGPSALAGNWTTLDDRVEIRWPDGNAWSRLETPEGGMPQSQRSVAQWTDEPYGVFVTDPRNATDASSFAGRRYLSGGPPGTLTAVRHAPRGVLHDAHTPPLNACRA